MPQLLFEIVSGEIPAKMQKNAIIALGDLLRENLLKIAEAGFALESWITPKRIGFLVTNLSPKALSVEEIRGPKVDAPDAAINGFLNKHGLTKDKLIARGDYYYVMIAPELKSFDETIAIALSSTLKNFVWPKSLKCRDSQDTWIRPIKNILALLEGEVVKFSYGGIESNNSTITYSNVLEKIANIDEYFKIHKDTKVILKSEDRIKHILAEIQSKVADSGLEIIKDQNLFEEVAGLVEFPSVFIAEIPKRYMQLPKEVLILTLRENQKYIMLQNKDGTLANKFVITANIAPTDKGEQIISGNLKVASARLEDAMFFYEDDSSKTLESYLPRLSKVVYHKDFGSYEKRIQVVRKYAFEVSKLIPVNTEAVNKAVELAKVDLVMHTVKEMPELQGLIGYYCALKHGLGEEIATAIRDQYKPAGPKDSLPENDLAKVVAVAEKLATLDILFSIGIKPTGSKDPYAQRRAAIGILRIIGAEKLEECLSNITCSDEIKHFIRERILALNT